jgi:cobalt-zinc-cadmium efflux system protein
MHNHSHADHHHPHHAAPREIAGSIFVIGIVLNALYVVVQVATGFYTHSMAMLADAGHNLSDVAALALSYFAFRWARMKATAHYTYGYKKSTILAALINAVVLLVTVGVLGFESVVRLFHPQPVEGGAVAIVAGIGIVINLGSAMLFFRDKDHDLNTKGAFLHLLTDAMVSLAVVIAGIVIRYTGWYWVDGAISIVVLIVILIGTWSLLTDSLRLTMDAVPHDVDLAHIEQVILGVKGVESMHHLHVWAMSTTQNALTTHVVVDDTLSFDQKMEVVHLIKHDLEHHAINHATIELESHNMPCHDVDC